MSSKQRKSDLPAGATGRVRSAVSGLRKPSAGRPKKTVLAGHGGVSRLEPVEDETPASESKPYSLPPFLGMFDLPADSSERVKAVVRGQDVA